MYFHRSFVVFFPGRPETHVELTSNYKEEENAERPHIDSFAVVVGITEELGCCIRRWSTKCSQFAVVGVTCTETKVSNLEMYNKLVQLNFAG